MKLRLHPNNEVVFKEPTLLQDYRIAPMLLLPFVENAFKHGLSASGKSTILIELDVINEQLHLVVSNSLHVLSDEPLDGSGIGLQNTKRRLNLLYPNRHHLSIEKIKDDTIYQVTLSLSLS